MIHIMLAHEQIANPYNSLFNRPIPHPGLAHQLLVPYQHNLACCYVLNLIH